MTTCAFDEVAAPHAHFHSSCYKFVGLAATLRECISLCGPGAAPLYLIVGGMCSKMYCTFV